MDIIRFGMGENIGFSTAGYLNMVCAGDTTAAAAGTCQGPPANGTVGAFSQISQIFAAIAQAAGYADCASVPTTGSTKQTITGTFAGTYTAYFETPTHKVPATWSGGGVKFQKRIRADFTTSVGGTAQALSLVMEGNCGSNQPAYVAASMAVGSYAADAYRDITVFSGPVSSTTNSFEVYMSEHNRTTPLTSGKPMVRGGTAIQVTYQPAASTFQAWGVFMTYLNVSNTYVAFLTRAALSGNYSTQQASVFADTFMDDGALGVGATANSNYFDTDGIALAATAAGNYNSTALTAGGSAVTVPLAANMTSDATMTTPLATLAGSNCNSTGSAGKGTAACHPEIVSKGCLTFTTTSGTTDGTYCTGFTPAAATVAPALDSTGSMTLKWVMETLPGLLEVVP